MTETNQRRFGLIDTMILIAGIAISLWITPETLAGIFGRAKQFVADDWRSWASVQWSSLLIIRSQPIVAVATLTILLLASRRSRSLRQLTDHPGSTACLAAALAILIVFPFSYWYSKFIYPVGVSHLVGFQRRVGDALTFRQAEGGVAVATAWLSLVIGGRWIRRADAVEWAGCLIGIYWIATLPLTWLRRP